MVKAIGLFSGGLDSILAVKLLQEQHIEIELVSFVTPFFNSRTVSTASLRSCNPKGVGSVIKMIKSASFVSYTVNLGFVIVIF